MPTADAGAIGPDLADGDFALDRAATQLRAFGERGDRKNAFHLWRKKTNRIVYDIGDTTQCDMTECDVAS